MTRVLELSVLLLLLATLHVKESVAAATIITTGADGAINCDGMRCPAGNGVRCLVNSATNNGKSTVHRQCVNAAGQVLLQSSYNVESPGLTFAHHTSSAVLYTKS